jgi:tetratricopeptide (TPR) repeat protein
MTNIIRAKPQPRPHGFVIGSENGNHTYHITTTNDSPGNPFMTTPGSDRCSAFEPVSPPKIDRRGVNVQEFSNRLDLLSKPTTTKNGKTHHVSPGDKTAATTSLQSQATFPTSLKSLETLPSGQVRQMKDEVGWTVAKAAMKDQIKQIKMNIPMAMKSMISPSSKKNSVDLADLTVAAICVVPRHGGGIAAGRMPFERIRTSLMLHMIQENQNSTWLVENIQDESHKSTKGKVQIAKLNTRLRNCIADDESCFVEKSQEVVKLAKNTLEELNAAGKSYLSKSEVGKRNLICVKFLSGMYREVINDERSNSTRDGLSLMVVGSAYYAIGKFEPALSVLQRAGIELSKKLSTSPEYNVYCAKLFNNMGCVYFEMGKYEKAMQTFQRALQLFHNDDGCNYAAWIAAIVDQASIMNNMAYTLIKFKRYDDASELVDTSFELQQILPDNTDKTMMISTLSTMAFIYYRTKKYKQSLDTYTACVQLQDKNPMYNECDHVEVLKKMADICKKCKDHEKRIYLLRCVVVYQQCYLLEDDDEVWETHSALAEAMQSFADAGGDRI